MYSHLSRCMFKRQSLTKASQPRSPFTGSLARTTKIPTSTRSLSSIPRPSQSASATKPSEFDRSPEELRKWNRTWEEPEYKLGKHRSNALELVSKVPVVEVDGNMAVCDGGGGALGHPLEYISLERPGTVEACKYCALRYTKKKKQ